MVTHIPSATVFAPQTRRFLRQTILATVSLMSVIPTAIATPVISNGTYLYGEAPTPNQLGSAYLVFQVHNQTLSGAAYWPGSSFECLSGQVQGVGAASPGASRLVLTFKATPSQPASTREIALTQRGIVANTGKTSPGMGLEGMHPIGKLSSNDRRILKTCQAQ